MVDFKNGDFVEVSFNLYANDKLVQTTDEKKGKEAKLNVKEYKPLNMILGRNFILKAFDEDIIKSKGKDNKLELSADEAYGRRKKEFLKTFTKSVFDEQKMRAIPGMTYDFNGMFGTVKSVIGGRVTVDFNNPLSGKNIILEYSNVKKIEDISKKISIVFKEILRIPENIFEISNKDKEIILKVPQQILVMKEQLSKSLEEIIPIIKDYNLIFEIKK